MSARAPVIVGLALALTGAVVASEARGETPVAAPIGAAPGVQMPAMPAGDVVASTWYCAAGTARSELADHTVIVVNPSDEPVTGTISVFAGDVAPPPDPVDITSGDGEGDEAGGRAPADGAEAEDEPSVADPWDRETGGTPTPGAVEHAIEVAPRGRFQLRLARVVQAPLAAALVEADGPVVVEHAVSGKAGRDTGPCASSASPDWYLAWGSTLRGARELLVLFNPFPSPATVDIEFSTDDGIRQPLRYQGFPVPAGAVVGLEVGDDVSREAQVAASVHTRSGSIVVERIVTFDGSREPYPEGIALALGAPRPLEAWAFADGRLASGRQEWIVVYNPTDERAVVDVSVRPQTPEGPARPPTPFTLSIRPGRYEVVTYADDERVPDDDGHATLVRSRNGVPVVAERVQAAPADARRSDVSVSLGAAFADRSWYVPSAARDERGSTRFVVFNPDPRAAARVAVTAVIDGEALPLEDYQQMEAEPGARREVVLPDEVVDPEAWYQVEADRPIVVERALTNRYHVIESVAPAILGGEDTLSVADIDVGR